MFKKILPGTLAAMLTAGAIMCTSASAASYSRDAKALGFNLDTKSYKNIGWVNEKEKAAYITDDAGRLVNCGSVYTQTLYATSKDKYLNNYQMDVWLTKTYTEPCVSSYMVNQFLWFKTNKTIYFYLNQLTEEETMPQNIKLGDHMATTPSQIITSSIGEGWDISLDGKIAYKDIEICGANIGGGWSKNRDLSLCYIKDLSRSNKFSVTYYMTEPYNSMTHEQQSYCYAQNRFYTAKHVYGTPSSMKKYLAPSNTTAVFKGKFSTNGTTKTTVTGSANISFSAMIGAW